MLDVTYKTFRGLNNKLPQERLGAEDLVLAENVDIDNSGRVTRRDGFSMILSGPCHSVYSHGDMCLFVSGAKIKRIGSDYSVQDMADVTAGRRMSFTTIHGRTYYNNGAERGVIDGGVSRSWGMEWPALPMAAPTVGTLPPGVYQYAMTYVREDGQESGTGMAGTVTVTDGGINFTEIPVSSDITVRFKVLYLTPANGDVLYQAMILSNTTTETIYADDGLRLTYPLQTSLLSAAPKGEIIAYHFGRMYIAQGRFVFYSEPFSLEHFDLRKYFGFSSNVRLIAAMEDGMWVGTDTEIAWIAGGDPDQAIKQQKANYGAIPGTMAYADAEIVSDGATGSAAIFWSHKGICAGFAGGLLKNLTGADYKINFSPHRGSGIIRYVDGSMQYLATLE